MVTSMQTNLRRRNAGPVLRQGIKAPAAWSMIL
jgi:hypothetical protein